MKIAAVVILYHPDKETPLRVKSYASHLNQVFVYDNTDAQNATAQHIITKIKALQNVHFAGDGKNEGLAVRLNDAAIKAKAIGCNWLLTMDQDSSFSNDVFLRYLACFNQYSKKEKVAMFGVQYFEPAPGGTACVPEIVPHLITSGSLVNLDLYTKLGGFDEALFIDKVDHDYCLSARQNNYQLIQFNNIYLEHHLGKVVWGRSLANFKLTPRTVHAPIRLYYIFRNYFYLKQKYKSAFPDDFVDMRKELIIRLKNNLLYGTQKRNVLRYVLKGYRDFRKGRMGKLTERK